MLKFFRKIRQKLISENRLRQYLIYACGEIILVIIGILLALQINNWNENRKIENDLNESLYAMKEELNENIEYMTKIKDSCSETVRELERIINESYSEEDLKNIVNYFGGNLKSQPFNKIYENLNDNKRIQRIGDKALIKQINEFYDYNLTSLQELSEWHKTFVINNIDPYILNNIPIENNQYSAKAIEKIFKEVKFQNILIYQKVLNGEFQKSNVYCIKKAKELLTGIDDYLARKDL